METPRKMHCLNQLIPIENVLHHLQKHSIQTMSIIALKTSRRNKGTHGGW